MTVNNSLNAPNAVIQKVSSSTSAKVTCTTILPTDDTVPTSSEGNEVLTVTITPTSATNKLFIEFNSFATPSSSNAPTMALFQDSTANALSSTNMGKVGAADQWINCSLRYSMTAGTTSSTTFKVRVGPQTGVSVYVNGYSASRLYGGTASTYLTVTEYQA